MDTVTHCDACGHSNGNHRMDADAACLVPECPCLVLDLGHARCDRCDQDTSEYDTRFSRWCGACRDEAEEEKVFFDRDDEPYRNSGVLGPWRVSYCCWSFSKCTYTGVVCRACYGEVYHYDGPANVADRFGRTHGVLA